MTSTSGYLPAGVCSYERHSDQCSEPFHKEFASSEWDLASRTFDLVEGILEDDSQFCLGAAVASTFMSETTTAPSLSPSQGTSSQGDSLWGADDFGEGSMGIFGGDASFLQLPPGLGYSEYGDDMGFFGGDIVHLPPGLELELEPFPEEVKQSDLRPGAPAFCPSYPIQMASSPGDGDEVPLPLRLLQVLSPEQGKPSSTGRAQAAVAVAEAETGARLSQAVTAQEKAALAAAVTQQLRWLHMSGTTPEVKSKPQKSTIPKLAKQRGVPQHNNNPTDGFAAAVTSAERAELTAAIALQERAIWAQTKDHCVTKAVPVQEAKSRQQPKFCSHCGHRITADFAFCPSCGKNLASLRTSTGLTGPRRECIRLADLA